MKVDLFRHCEILMHHKCLLQNSVFPKTINMNSCERTIDCTFIKDSVKLFSDIADAKSEDFDIESVISVKSTSPLLQVLSLFFLKFS